MNIKLNNKGMSLLELIIAIAIASVVSLLIASMMTNGTSMFKRESDRIDLQNDLQVVQNQLTQKLMEAQEINIVKVKNSDDYRIYTGKIDSDGKEVVSESGAECLITYYDGKLYVTNEWVGDMSSISNGFLIADNVMSFDFSIATEKVGVQSAVEQPDGSIVTVTTYYYDNPISVKMKMDVGNDKSKKSVEEVIKIRNKINEYNVYEVDSFSEAIDIANPDEKLNIR